MAALLRKASRVNLVAMDFMLQVTVEELVLGTLDAGRTLSFELSRGTKASGLPPKQVVTTQSEWNQTMQMHLTLFLDKRTSRFQDKEYKLRLVQKDNRGMLVPPVLATFTLDASLYAHLGVGPSVEQQVDLYAPKLNGLGGCATVRLRVRCCEPREGPLPVIGRSVSASDLRKDSTGMTRSSGSGLPPRGAMNHMRRPSLPPLQSALLVGSSFGFSMSGSDSRQSVGSTGSSGFSTPMMQRPGRPWSTEDLDVTSTLSFRSKLVGSKSFNNLDENEQCAPLSRGGVAAPGLRSMSFNGILGSNEDSSSRNQSSGRGPATGVLTSSSSSSVTDMGSKASQSPQGFGPRYDRTTTVGYNRLLARFTKGPSPRAMKPIPRGMTGIQFPLPHIPQGTAALGRTITSSSSDALPEPAVSSGDLSGGSGGGDNDHGSECVMATKPPSFTSTLDGKRNNISADDDEDGDDSAIGKVAAAATATASAAAAAASNGAGKMNEKSGEGGSGSGVGGDGGVTTAGGSASSGSVSLSPDNTSADSASLSLSLSSSTTMTPTPTSIAITTATAAATATAIVTQQRYHQQPPSVVKTATKGVGTTSNSVGTNTATIVEKASLIAVMLEQQRNNYKRRNATGSASGGEVGEGGGGGGGEGASAAPLHQSGEATNTSITNSNNHTTNPEKPVLPLSRPGAGVGARHLDQPCMGTPMCSESGRGLRAPHPMMGAPHDMEDMENSVSLGGGGASDGDDKHGTDGRGPTAALSDNNTSGPIGLWMQNEGSAGGGRAAEAAPLSSSVPMIVGEGVELAWGEVGRVGTGEAAAGGNGGSGVVGGAVAAAAGIRRIGSGQEGMREMCTRVLHLEAALVRSELDLRRAKTELMTVRQEAHAMRKAKDVEDQERPSSADVAALYHALEGSVVLLQMASEKMVHLEHCLEKYRGVLPGPVLTELQKCVTQDAIVTSPLPVRMD